MSGKISQQELSENLNSKVNKRDVLQNDVNAQQINNLKMCNNHSK